MFPYPSAKCTSEDPSPVGVSVTLSSSVVFFEPPLVARWDASGTNTSIQNKPELYLKHLCFVCLSTDKQWRTDGITDISFKEAEAKISFKMETFLPFVLMQKTYINLPFQSWELQPLGPSSARFSINGPLFDLSITVQVTQTAARVVWSLLLHDPQWAPHPSCGNTALNATHCTTTKLL